MLAVGTAQHEVGRVSVPAAINAQVFGTQVGFAGVGQPAGEPQAFDLVRVRLQQAQCPVQKKRVGASEKGKEKTEVPFPLVRAWVTIKPWKCQFYLCRV